VAVRVTDETVVLGAPEVHSYSAESAERAFGLADDLLSACLANPKPATAEWAKFRAQAWANRHGQAPSSQPPSAAGS